MDRLQGAGSWNSKPAPEGVHGFQTKAPWSAQHSKPPGGFVNCFKRRN